MRSTCCFTRKQSTDRKRRMEVEDLYSGHQYEIPQVETVKKDKLTILINILQDDTLLSFKIEDDGVYNMREGEKAEILKFSQQKTKIEETFQKPIGKPSSFKFENFGKGY